jgi:outer membrane biosynthesis protein TonB
LCSISLYIHTFIHLYIHTCFHCDVYTLQAAGDGCLFKGKHLTMVWKKPAPATSAAKSTASEKENQAVKPTGPKPQQQPLPPPVEPLQEPVVQVKAERPATPEKPEPLETPAKPAVVVVKTEEEKPKQEEKPAKVAGSTTTNINASLNPVSVDT